MALGSRRSSGDDRTLRLGFPSGSLQSSMAALFQRAGFPVLGHDTDAAACAALARGAR